MSFEQLILLMLVSTMTGCAIGPSGNHPYRLDGRSSGIRLEAANRKPFTAHLCFSITGNGAEPPRHLEIRLPMPDGPMHISHLQGNTPLWRVWSEDVTEGSCSRSGNSMAVLEVEPDDNKAVPADKNEAIYVSYHEGVLVRLGYVSKKPIFADHHGYAVDLDKIFTPRRVDVEKTVKEVGRGTALVVGAVFLTLLYFLLVLCELDSECGEAQLQ